MLGHLSMIPPSPHPPIGEFVGHACNCQKESRKYRDAIGAVSADFGTEEGGPIDRFYHEKTKTECAAATAHSRLLPPSPTSGHLWKAGRGVGQLGSASIPGYASSSYGDD